MDWTDFASRPVPWVGNTDVSRDTDGPPFAILTRVFAYRNFSGLPFVVSAPPKDCAAAADLALRLLSRSGSHSILRLAECPPKSIRVLRERLFLPRRFAAFPGKRGFKYLAVASGGAEWVLLNEVEHLTFGRISPGRVAPRDFGAVFTPPEGDGEDPTPWAWSRRYGFLASDPARIGPGAAAELLVHLPGLALSRRLPQAGNYLAAAGLAMVPACADSGCPDPVSASDAGLFWLKSRGGLGKTSGEAYAAFSSAAEPVLAKEREAQQRCLEKHPKRLEERVKQSLQLLARARTLSYADMLALGSFARLGAYLGMLDPGIPRILEELRITAGTGHLSVSPGGEMAKEEEDFLRANVVRSSLETYGG